MRVSRLGLRDFKASAGLELVSYQFAGRPHEIPEKAKPEPSRQHDSSFLIMAAFMYPGPEIYPRLRVYGFRG